MSQGGRCAVGVDLGGTKIAIALVDESGRVLRHERIPTDAKRGADVIRGNIADAVRAVRKGAEPAAMGVAVAGQIDAARGVVRFGPNLDWHDVALGEPLGRELDLPVVVTNDVRAAAFGEWRFGAGRGFDDLACFFVGTGVGGGLVSGGRLVEGGDGIAGELGHVSVALDGPRCHCGNRGCLEAFAGGRAIGERGQRLAAHPELGRRLREQAGNAESVTGQHVAEAAAAGDPLCREILHDAVRALASGVASVVNALNPQRVVLGGGVIEAHPDWVDTVRVLARERALAAAWGELEVVRAALGGESGAVGAAAYALTKPS